MQDMLFAGDETEQYILNPVDEVLQWTIWTKGSRLWFKTPAWQFSYGGDLMLINSFDMKLAYFAAILRICTSVTSPRILEEGLARFL